MANLFPVNGDLEGAYMKQIKLFFLILILCICIIGCDEGMIDPMQLADIVSQYETTVQTELPDEVLAAMKLKADEMSKIVHSRIHVEQHITELTTPEDVQNYQERRQWMIDNGYDKIDYFHELQKSYYTKYIDAASIAIVAPTHTRTKYLLDARDAIVVMTSKHPELRERLLSKHGKFYMVLVPEVWDLIKFPEVQLHSSLLDDDPTNDSYVASCNTRYGRETPYKVGYCWAAVGTELSSARTFVHEFAHALESEMERLKPGFEDKLRNIYKDSKEAPWYEYWASAVEIWFYSIRPGKYEEFFERHPSVAEVLDEWFPRVTLRKKSMPRIYNEDTAQQAYAILEKHCFECHGENGTHKDVLLIDNAKQLFEAGVIVPADPEGSRLFRRLLGPYDDGPQMPLGKPPLSDEEIDIIETWLFFSHRENRNN